MAATWAQKKIAWGRAALAGSSPDVGVAGYTLGGGLSFLGRKHGLAASNMTAAEVVTADGTLVCADSEHEPDLFWALREGGGSFGIIIALEFRLFPITQAYAGALWYPIQRGSEVLHAWGELTEVRSPTSSPRSAGSSTFRRSRRSPSRSAASRSCSSRPTTSATRPRPTSC